MDKKKNVLLCFIALVLILNFSFAWYTDDPNNVKGTSLRLYSDSQYANCGPLGDCTTLIKVSNTGPSTQYFVLDTMFPKNKGVTIKGAFEQKERKVTKYVWVDESCTVKEETVVDDKNGFTFKHYLCVESGQYFSTDKDLTYSKAYEYQENETYYVLVSGSTSKLAATYNTQYYDSAKYETAKRITSFQSLGINPGESKIVRVDFKVPKGSSGEFLVTTDKSGSFLDPWWSTGDCGYRQKVTFDTSPLGGDVTSDHTVLVYVGPSNTDFWGHTTNGTDWNGVTFVNASDTTEYDFDVEKYSHVDDNAFFWVEVTDTFTSGADTDIYMYYGCTNTNYADGTSAYPSDMNIFLQFKDGSGTTATNSTGKGNFTLSAGTGWITSGVAGAYNFTGLYATGNLSSPYQNYTITTEYSSSMSGNQTVWGTKYNGPSYSQMMTRSAAPCAGDIGWNAGVRLCAGLALTAGKTYWNGGTYTNSTTNKQIFMDGVNKGNQNDSMDPAAFTNIYLSTYGGSLGVETLTGKIDNFRMWNRVLSDDEVELVYLSDSRQLTSFSAEEAQVSYVIDFNVFGIHAPTTQLTNWNMDCNDGTTYDGNFTTKQWNMLNGTYACKFTRTGYDVNGNGTTTYLIIADQNKIGANGYKIYLTDSTAPTLGAPSLTGFTTYTTYIKGTGNIASTITDAGSGVNTTQCEYKATGAWVAADGNSTHCYKNGIIIANATSYTFGLRGKDNAGNQGTSTNSSTYTGDTAGPTTTASIVDSNILLGKDINLLCTDIGSGCKTIAYKIDSGDWNYIAAGSIIRTASGIGDHNIYYYSSDNLDNNETQKISSYTISPDSIFPTLAYTLTKTYGFTSDYNIAFTLACYDNQYTPLAYDVNINDTNNIHHSKDANATLLTDWVIIPPTTLTQFTFSCTDSSGNETKVSSSVIYSITFRLINETTGLPLSVADLNNLSIARVYSIDGNYSYDFNALAKTTTTFVAPTTKVIFEFTDKSIIPKTIQRFIDFSYADDQNIPICALTATYTSLYGDWEFPPLTQQRFVSNQERIVTMKNNVANCYSLIGGLVYAYDVGFAQTINTINKPYYLYFFSGGVKTFLSYIDGASSNSYNLDTIIFSKQPFTLNVDLDGVSIYPLVLNGVYVSETVQIYYKNFYQDNTSTLIQIYQDSNLIFSHNETDSPNEFFFNFYWGAIPTISIDSNNLRLVLTTTDSNGINVSTTYFNVWGDILAPPVTALDGTIITQGKMHIWAALASILIFFFGITVIAASRVFGFFGIIICLIAMILAGFATAAWYGQLLEAAFIVILLWILMVGKQGQAINLG